MIARDNDLQSQKESRSRGKIWWKISASTQPAFDNQKFMNQSVATVDEFDSSSSSIQSGSTGIFSSGCMKVRTQDQSLRRQFGASKESENKKVHFSTIDLHVHRLVLGDNPSISSGPPLTIGWRSEFSTQLSVDEYEQHHPDRRGKYALQVPRSLREDWLKDEGYSRSEMKEAETSALVVKAHRTKAANQGVFLRAMAKSTESFLRRNPKTCCPV
jgi:hypothetical protein